MSSLPSSGPSAGGRRFWFTVLLFALANIAIWMGYHLWQSDQTPRRDILAMQRFNTNLDGAGHQPPLTWTFNLDVAHTGPAAQSVGQIKPAVAGMWLWTSPRTLAFQPVQPLPLATRFTATLSPAMLTTADGYSLPAPVTTSFSTAALQLLSVKQAGFDNYNAMLLELTFNDKVIPAEVGSRMKITDENGVSIKASVNGQAAGTIVRLLTEPLRFPDMSKDHTLTVTLGRGLAGISGPLGLDGDAVKDVTVSSSFTAESLQAHVPWDGDPQLTVEFNNSIEDSTVTEMTPLISVEPKVEFSARREYPNGVTLSGAFSPATRYTVTIAKSPANVPHGLREAATLSVFIPDRDPGAYFENTDGYLGSAGNRTVLVKAANVQFLRITASKVYENNLVAWRNPHQHWAGDIDNYTHPIASHRYTLPVEKNVVQDLRVNLDELLGKEQATDGVYKLTLHLNSSPDADEDQTDYYDGESNISTIVTLSDIGLTSKLMADPNTTTSEQALLTWAVSLSTSKPLAGVKLRIYSDKNQLLGEGTTDDNGLGRIEHLNPADGERPAVLIAQDADKALTYLDLIHGQRNDRENTPGGRAYLRSGYEAFVFAERGVYRPGETVTLRAIVRGKDLMIPQAGMPLRFQMRRPDGRDWISQSVQLDADGACEWKVPFPDDAQTGYWSAQLGLPGETATASLGTTDIQIEDFIPDRIKTALTPSGKTFTPSTDNTAARLALSDDPLLVDIQSDYLFGQPAANLQTTLSAIISPSGFTSKQFPSADGWISGDTANAVSVLGDKRPNYDRNDLPAQTLDKNGHAQFAIDLAKRLTPTDDSLYAYRGPWNVWITGTTLESGGRPVTGTSSTQADALPYYILLRPTGAARDGYIGMKQTAQYDIRLVTPTGEIAGASQAKLTATVFDENWETTLVHDRDHYQYQSTRTLTPVKDAADLPVSTADGFAWKPTGEGSYVIQIADTSTHQICTVRLYADDFGGWNAGIDRTHPEALQVELVPATPDAKNAGKKLFSPGQSVKAVIHSPFAGEVLLTIETDTVEFTKVTMLEKSTGELTFDLPAGVHPNGFVSATVIRPIEPNKPWQSHRAFGMTGFRMDPADETLGVAISAPSEIRPQAPLDVQLTLTMPDGRPAKNAAVALAAVDEGILRLTDFETPSPIEFFHAPRALGVDTSDLYDELMPEVAKPENQSATGGDADSKEFSRRHSSPVSAKRVRPVSLVSDIVHTDEMGHATVHLMVPEFLGQLRVMAVSYDGPLMGSAEKSVIVRSPLVVQSSFPRFLAPGDRCDATLVLINNTQAAGAAHLQLTTDAALAFDRNALDVTLNSNEQKTLTVSLSAQQVAAVGHIAIEATLNGERYTEQVELPIRPASPAITRGDSIRASVDKDVALDIPSDLLPGTAFLQVRIAPRPALNLPQALQYLDQYPYGCLEQTTSEAFPLVYIHDLGNELAPNLFDQQRVNHKVQVAIQRLMSMQTASGGLAMWPGGNEEWQWGTVYAAHFLIEAEHAGYTIPADFKAHTLSYLHLVLSKSAEIGEDTDIDAYALYVLALDGHPDRAAMNRLGEILAQYAGNSAPPDGLSDARFHLALAWTAAGRADAARQLIPDQLPTIATARTLHGYISSPITDQSLMLETLLTISPDHPAIPSIVERLAAAGQNQKWESTQDNAMALFALGKYLRTTKGEKTFDSATLSNGDKPLATTSGKPLLWSGSAKHLTIHLAGAAGATGYVSWLQTGVPTTPPADADHALKIRRAYLTEDGQPLSSAISTGTAVKVQITIDSASPLDNLVIEDLLPAGLEIENPRLTTTAKQDASPTSMPTFSPDRLDVRDDRLIAVGNLPAGHITYTYLARAVTVGDYTLPPIHGECMYDPAVNSMNGAGTLHIVSEKKALALK